MTFCVDRKKCLVLLRTVRMQFFCSDHAGIWSSQIAHYWSFHRLGISRRSCCQSQKKDNARDFLNVMCFRVYVIKQFILFFPELSTFKGFVLYAVANTFAACISHLQYLDPVTIKLLTFGASYNYLLLLLFLMGIVLSCLSSFPKHWRDL